MKILLCSHGNINNDNCCDSIWTVNNGADEDSGNGEGDIDLTLTMIMIRMRLIKSMMGDFFQSSPASSHINQCVSREVGSWVRLNQVSKFRVTKLISFKSCMDIIWSQSAY